MISGTFEIANEAEMMAFAASFKEELFAGDVVLLEGPLGAGKTTLVRGLLLSLGFDGPVRSPTFNLIQTFPTDPSVMHADLYRLKSTRGTGIDDYFVDHLCLIEWPDRAEDLVVPTECWRIEIAFRGEGRMVKVSPPEVA